MITVEKHLAVMDDGFTINNYIVTDVETGETAVIDPSLSEEKLLEKLNGKNIKYILLTHGHFDHICGAKMVKDNTGAKIVIHKDDDIMLHDSSTNEFDANCQGYSFPEVDADIFTEDGTELMLGNTKITVMHTPGHSMGSVCYLFKEDLIMFVIVWVSVQADQNAVKLLIMLKSLLTVELLISLHTKLKLEM